VSARPTLTALSQAVGARLRELRRDAELTQEQIARAIGSHRPIIGRIERGKHVLSVDVLQRYARALDLDVATVLAPVDIDGLVRL
jgi:transcriptional regulator with XRE-family HTH domain